ncbi:MAG: two-component system response regulator [Bacteroidetes bacterium]|nr:MAG: two-component system response regulator [Bacteroidota bacterium]
MDEIMILWVDDEIDLLRPHVIFLEEKGYKVSTSNNGDEALTMIDEQRFDLIFLDENMPGLSGIETLVQIKDRKPELPVVMVTKSEEEDLMDEAIGSKISDYLIKPVNPKQILLSIKKNIDTKRLVSEKTTSGYQQDFRNIGASLNDRMDHAEWGELYRKLVYWELELEKADDKSMEEVLKMQKTEANSLFCKFVQANYHHWLANNEESPMMSHTLFKNIALPILESENTRLIFVLIDNLRYDQWKSMMPLLSDDFELVKDDVYYGILPTATQYSRNAIFAGLMPLEIEKKFPGLWLNDGDEGGKNLNEEHFLNEQLLRYGQTSKFSYTKITNLNSGKKLVENIHNVMSNKLNVIVYNFVDILSHARTEMDVLKELAEDEAAYRSLTLSWFEHSPLLACLKRIAGIARADKTHKYKLIITTDHGSIRVKEPSRLIGDKNTTTNLRYKQGKNLTYEEKDVFSVGKPEDAFLPKVNISSRYVFAKEDKYFVYPNNYNHFMNLFKNSFQHGGLSMEEVLIPVATLEVK